MPILAVGSWMSHLEQDWDVPMSFDLMVDDLSAVMDRIDEKKVTLFGPSQAASVSIAFAIKHPEKVAGLILYDAYHVAGASAVTWKNNKRVMH